MESQVIAIDEITRSARAAAEAGLPPSVCPLPAGSEAAIRWQVAYHRCEMDAPAEMAA